MQNFTLNIELGNDGMQDGADVAHAIRRLAEKLDRGSDHGIICDVNGNTVGSWALLEGRKESS